MSRFAADECHAVFQVTLHVEPDEAFDLQPMDKPSTADLIFIKDSCGHHEYSLG